jgi:hypothetical protein
MGLGAVNDAGPKETTLTADTTSQFPNRSRTLLVENSFRGSPSAAIEARGRDTGLHASGMDEPDIELGYGVSAKGRRGVVADGTPHRSFGQFPL